MSDPVVPLKEGKAAGSIQSLSALTIKEPPLLHFLFRSLVPCPTPANKTKLDG